MRQIKDKGIAKLYAAALRAKKAKHTKGEKHPAKRHGRPQAKRRSSPRAKVATVMREFYAGGLTTHGRRVPRGRPDIAKAIAMSEGRAVSKPKRRKRKSAKRAAPKRRIIRRTTKRQSRPQVQLDHRVIRHAAPKVLRTAAAGARKRKTRAGGKRKASPAQLAARKKFVAMVRARAADKKGPNRRKR